MSSLYDLNFAIASYQMEFDPETGEWINEQELTDLEMARDEKVEQLALLVKNLEAEKTAVKAESDNLSERAKGIDNQIKRYKDYIATALNGEKFSTPRVLISYRKSESVEILNEDAVPERFLDISVVRKPMKNEIKKYLKNTDENIPWARLEVKNNLQLK